MKIFLIERTDAVGYDEYDSFVCVAEDELSAKKMHPENARGYKEPEYFFNEETQEFSPVNNAHIYRSKLWVKKIDSLKTTEVTLDGERRFILTNFNAG